MSKKKQAEQEPELTPVQREILADLDRIDAAGKFIRERVNAIAIAKDQKTFRNLHQQAVDTATWAAALADPPEAAEDGNSPP